MSTDVDTSDNHVDVIGKLIMKANLRLYSRHTPEQIFYNDQVIGQSAMKIFENIGPIIEHVYLVENLGPFSINSFEMNIHWPFELNPSESENIHGKHLLYLTDRPKVSLKPIVRN